MSGGFPSIRPHDIQVQTVGCTFPKGIRISDGAKEETEEEMDPQRMHDNEQEDGVEGRQRWMEEEIELKKKGRIVKWRKQDKWSHRITFLA